MRKRLYGLFAVLLVATMLLAACKPAATRNPWKILRCRSNNRLRLRHRQIPGKMLIRVVRILFSGISTHKSVRLHYWRLWTNSIKPMNGVSQLTQNIRVAYGDIFNKMLGVLNSPDAPDIVVAYQNQAATYQLSDALT